MSSSPARRSFWLICFDAPKLAVLFKRPDSYEYKRRTKENKTWE
jgi:hypothetical protein